VIHRHTQTAEYWQTFTFKPDDAEFIYNILLEAGKPKRTNELARALIKQRVEQENVATRRQLGEHAFYQPSKTYSIGEKLSFPALHFASGVVEAVRPGNNPDLGEFDVITVEMTEGGKREFVAQFKQPHKLNDVDVMSLIEAEGLKTPDELADLHTAHVSAILNEALSKNGELIRIGEDWFLRAMMAEVNVGHLNLAEAVLDVANGGPLPTHVILRDLGLPEDMAGSVQEASLNSALGADERFDEVSINHEPAWFLRRLEPAEVRERPSQLEPIAFSGAVTLSDELTTLARQIDDELDNDINSAVEPAQVANVILNFSHLRAGTLGWNRTVTSVLPLSNKPRLPITFKDKTTKKEMVVWLVQDGRYIWGLGDFYKSNELPAGAQIELSKSEYANLLWIDSKKHKSKREWVRVASNRDGRLHLETAQRAVTSDFDELMSVFADHANSLDALRDKHKDVAQAVREAFPEIAKLSPQGNVHARTLYAVVNTLMRASARNVFAALIASGAYVPVGDNYWHIGER
jgi:hypothetical protein